MSNKKQTAVELLEQQLKERYSLMNSEPLFEQARNIHRQEIQEAFIEGSKLEFVNENSLSQSLEARFEALLFYKSKYEDNE